MRFGYHGSIKVIENYRNNMGLFEKLVKDKKREILQNANVRIHTQILHVDLCCLRRIRIRLSMISGIAYACHVSLPNPGFFFLIFFWGGWYNIFLVSNDKNLLMYKFCELEFSNDISLSNPSNLWIFTKYWILNNR